MAKDFEDTGSLQVDGRRVNAVRYEVMRADDPASTVRVRFMDGRRLVAKVEVDRPELGALIGAANQAAIELEVGERARAVGGPASREPIRGVLRGEALRHQDVTLPPEGAQVINEIGAATLARGVDSEEVAPEQADPETPTAPAPDADSTEAEHPAGGAVPPWVTAKFVKVGNRYYFADRTLAFVDRGNKLRAHTHNREVVRSLLAIAQARNWTAIHVSGSDDFKRLVWREGEALGLQVQGYTPDDFDRATAPRPDADRRESDGREVEEPPDARHAPPHTAEQGHAKPAQPEQAPEFERISGRLIASGADHYKFDRRKTLSYYVKLQTPHGERTLWGSDPERALVESKTQPQVGDRVEIERRGSVPVTVKVPQRDASGSLVGEERQIHQRTTWVVERPTFFEDRQRKAQALRSGFAAARELAREHPDLVHAVVSLWLAEQFANRQIERCDDRERVVALVRERLARALERGDEIVVPRLHQQPVVPPSEHDGPNVERRARARMRAPSRAVTAAQERGAVAAAQART